MKKVLVILIALALLGCVSVSMAETEKLAELPAYMYTGDDPIVGAISNYLVANSPEYAEDDRVSVLIPAPVILKTVMKDDDHAVVYGNFWIMGYTPEGKTLVCINGGENPGIMELEKADSIWKVTSFEQAGEGTDYSKDIVKFSNGDKELEKSFFSSADAQKDPLLSVREQFIREYVEANHLAIDAYQDMYWDPILLVK